MGRNSTSAFEGKHRVASSVASKNKLMSIKQSRDYVKKSSSFVFATVDYIYVCACSCYAAVGLSACLLYTESDADTVCRVAGLAIHSSGSVPTPSHPWVSTFLHSSVNKASQPTVNYVWAVRGVTGSFLFDQSSFAMALTF